MKLLFKNNYARNGTTHEFPLESLLDFHNLISKFPQLDKCLYENKDLRAIAKAMSLYLNSHHVKSWIEE